MMKLAEEQVLEIIPSTCKNPAGQGLRDNVVSC